ncbi:hypothetical protein K1719_039916 [Acacia pycnantha]|nr:hypothetical protein K1719_039916 [Acacia pycnantha]
MRQQKNRKREHSQTIRRKCLVDWHGKTLGEAPEKPKQKSRRSVGRVKQLKASHFQGKVIMGELRRPRDEVWERVTRVEGGWMCNDCGMAFAGGATRIKAHLNKVKGEGIQPCTGEANSNNYIEHNILHSQGEVIMGKEGRRRDDVWKQVTPLEGDKKRWKCNDCGHRNSVMSPINKYASSLADRFMRPKICKCYDYDFIRQVEEFLMSNCDSRSGCSWGRRC